MARLDGVFSDIHIVGTGRAGSAIRARLREQGVRVTDGRAPDPVAELVLLCVPDGVIAEVDRAGASHLRCAPGDRSV